MEYASIEAERNVVAVVQAMEAILACHANGCPGGIVTANNPAGGLVLWLPGESKPKVLYSGNI